MSLYIILTLIFLLTLGIGIFVTPYIAALSRELHLYDLPDSRKIHTQPIPRLGGATFLPSVCIATTLMLTLLLRFGVDVTALLDGVCAQNFLAYVSGAMILYTIGLYDDISGVSYKTKFIAQILAAAILCIGGLWVANFSGVFFINEVPFWIGMPFSILMVVYVTNAMNLIDGIDGLASGLATLALAVIAALYIIIHDEIWSMICVALIGVLVAFFYYNVFTKKNKIFMGDAGSLTIGYTLSFLILHFWQRNPVTNEYLHNVGIIALSTIVIPMFDVVRVFMSRIRDHRNPFLPDKNHIHHKLMRAGLNGKTTMVVILLLSCMFIISNYYVASFFNATLMVVMDVIMFCLMHIIINIFIYRKEGKSGIKWDRAL